ncbi:MAG: rRNA m(5)U939 methyltransferase, partial [Cyanobacteriota bacterium]
MRNLLFRTALHENQLMVALIHNDDMEQQLHGIINFIKTQFPQISSLVSIYNGKSNDSYSELPWTVHKGDGFIYE